MRLKRWAPFHFVTQGACVVELSDLGRTILLSAGDALLLPRGTSHVLRGPNTPAGARGKFGIRSHPLACTRFAVMTARFPIILDADTRTITPQPPRHRAGADRRRRRAGLPGILRRQHSQPAHAPGLRPRRGGIHDLARGQPGAFDHRPVPRRTPRFGSIHGRAACAQFGSEVKCDSPGTPVRSSCHESGQSE
jgi:hypothetical protein